MVECEASTFPLVNLTKVSMAAHSTQCFGLQLFYGQKVAFWRLSFFNSKYLLAPSKAGLILNPIPASPASTVGGGDSPSYSGFFHCLAVFDDQSSTCLNPGSLLLGTKSFSTGPSSRVALVHPVRLPVCLYFRLRNSLKLISCSSP